MITSLISVGPTKDHIGRLDHRKARYTYILTHDATMGLSRVENVLDQALLPLLDQILLITGCIEGMVHKVCCVFFEHEHRRTTFGHTAHIFVLFFCLILGGSELQNPAFSV